MLEKVSAVLPLNISEDDKSNSCDLADILFSSILKFARDFFDTIYLVCPTKQLREITRFFSKYEHKIPLIFMDENELVPEFKRYKSVGGWTKQQVIKLAMAAVVKTPFYITLDADVVCTHPLKYDSLFPMNKGILQIESKQTHSHWWTSSAHILGLKTDLMSNGMSVTPAILATDGVLGLIQELSKEGSWVDRLLKPHHPYSIQRFLPGFRKKYRWTEYSLYYLFLEKNDLINKYHVLVSPESSYNILISQNSVWSDTSFENWDHASCFSEDSSFFVVIQSNKNILPRLVLDRIGKYLN